ncbi:MAG: IPT/TIG domain-containing protein [Bryobacteraceae bacterium]
MEPVAGNGVSGFSGDGGRAVEASITSVGGVAVDGAGNVYISEWHGSRIRRVTPDGLISTYSGTGRSGYSGDGGPARSAELNYPAGLFVDGEGTLFIADYDNYRVRKVTAPRPSISSTNSAVPSFFGKSGFGSNMYVEIYGTNLATTTRSWRGSDFNDSRAPTSLDGVSVSVNGKPAYVYYVSPTQININTPEDTATGAVNIQVTNSLGVSNLGSAMRTRVSPALQSVPSFTSQGRSHVVAQTPDFRSFIGRPGMVQGVNFTLAKPGDSIILYALGCGPTSPPTEAGVAAGANARLALPFELKIGGVPAPVAFAGIVAGSIGLYQINATIPPVNGGDQPIELVVDGVSNNQNLYLAIEGQAVTTGVEPPAGYTFTRIAHNAGTPAFSDLQTDFSINENGTVVFTGIQNDRSLAIYSGVGQELRLIAGTSVGGYVNLASGGINRHNTVVFAGRRADGNVEIMTDSPGTRATRVAVGPNIPLTLETLPDINDNGDVAYFDGTRVILVSNGVSRAIADTSAPGPVAGAVLRGLQLNQRGDVAFSASNRPEVYLYQNGGVSVVASRGSDFPAVAVSSPTLNNRGQIAFFAHTNGDVSLSGFYWATLGVRPQTMLPGGSFQVGTTLSWERISLNDGGVPVFAVFDLPSSAIYAGPDPGKRRVIASGEPHFGGTLSAVYAGAAAGGKFVNNRGQIGFIYVQQDRSFGIAVATPQ